MRKILTAVSLTLALGALSACGTSTPSPTTTMPTNTNASASAWKWDGTMLSALDSGIVRSAYENWPSYLGWRPYGTPAPPGDTFVIAPLLADTESDFPRMPAWP